MELCKVRNFLATLVFVLLAGCATWRFTASDRLSLQGRAAVTRPSRSQRVWGIQLWRLYTGI